MLIGGAMLLLLLGLGLLAVCFGDRWQRSRRGGVQPVIPAPGAATANSKVASPNPK